MADESSAEAAAPQNSTLYLCKNASCTLGTPQQYGRFTGGMTAVAKHLLTGRPLESLVEGEDYGDGFCPNCGVKGEEWDSSKALDGAIKEADAQHEERIAAMKSEGVN